MKDKFLRDNSDIINARNFIIIGLIAIRLCSESSYLFYNENVYKLSYADYLIKIISAKGFNIMSIMVFWELYTIQYFIKMLKSMNL